MARCNCTMFGTSVAAVSLDPGLRAKRCPEIPRGCGVFKHDSLSTLPSLASRPDKSGCSSVCLCIAQTNLFQKASDPWKEDPNKSPRYEKKKCPSTSARHLPSPPTGEFPNLCWPFSPRKITYETSKTPWNTRNPDIIAQQLHLPCLRFCATLPTSVDGGIAVSFCFRH